MNKRDFNSFLDPVHQIRRIKSWKSKRQVVYFVPVPKVSYLSPRSSRSLLCAAPSFEDNQTNPNLKMISFVVNFRASSAQFKEKISGQRKVTLTFEKDATGEWKVVDYAHSDPRKNVRL